MNLHGLILLGVTFSFFIAFLLVTQFGNVFNLSFRYSFTYFHCNLGCLARSNNL
jgi:hypothetical protein